MKWTKECGKRLRETRGALGWTLGDLSRKTGNGLASLSDWERFQSPPKQGDLTVLASVFGASVPYLLCQTDDPKGGAEPFEKPSLPRRWDPPEPPITRDDLAVVVRKERRDKFAAAALTGLLTRVPSLEPGGEVKINSKNAAKTAWLLADAMLENDS